MSTSLFMWVTAMMRAGIRSTLLFFGANTNLHHVWDTSIIQRYTGSDTNTLITDLRTLIAQEPDLVKQYESITTPSKWANESFQYVRSDVYQFTPSSFMQGWRKTKEPSLGTWYYNQNLPVVQQRLVAASVRLAQLLNSIFS